MQNASVRLTNIATGVTRETSTDSAGAYLFPAIDPGRYDVAAEKDRFMRSTHQGVVVELERETVVNHTMEIGDMRESVLVTGAAHSIEASSSTISNLVDQKTIEELPLNGRDYIQLATLQAGAPVARAQLRGIDNGYGIQLSIAGSRPYQNNFRLDGMSISTYTGSTPGSINGVNLGVDAIREFSVLSSAYGAHGGRAAGGVINAVTRSGGNDMHGSVFYFHRNDNLDARNFFDGREAPEYRRHQFGGSLGGPIVRNNTFFFANYEALREERGTTRVNTTLSESARRGDLSSGAVAVDPSIARLLALYPLPNGEVLGDTALYRFQNTQLGDEDFFTTRLDHNLSDADKLFFRYFLDDGNRSEDTDFALSRQSDGTRVQSLVAESLHIFSPRMLNTARLGFLRTRASFGMTTSVAPGLDDPALTFVPGAASVGLIEVSGLTAFPGGTGSLEHGVHVFNSFQASDDVTWIRGAHSVKFGVSLERTHLNSDNPARLNGEYRFRSSSQFLTNKPDRFRTMAPGSCTAAGYRQWVGGAYIQDTWKISPRVTLDLGLRHEWASVPTEVNGMVANLDELTSTEMRIGDPLFENPSLRNFAPRAGIAWDVWGNGATVIRSGYGIYPDLVLSHFLLIAGFRNPPFFLRGNTRDLQTGDFPKKGYDAFLENMDAELRVERFPREIEQPYAQHWNFNVEQRVGISNSLRLGYVGSRGAHLSSVTNDANLATPTVLPDGRLYFPEDAERINPYFSQIRNRTFDASSFYHGLHTEFRRRISRGLQAQLSYSFSKSIDDSSTYLATGESPNSILLPINGSPRFNRGLSSHDVRHSVVLSGTWEPPSPAGRLARRLFGGWQAGYIVSYASGLPFSARLGYDAARTLTSTPNFQSGQRPDAAPGATGVVTGDPRGWVSPGAFLRPEDGFLGNLGRNTIIGPDMANMDLSLTKRMRIPAFGESAHLDFRAEFFNLFNRANFDLPSSERMELFSRTSTREDFARITSAAASREIQFGLKLRF